MPVQAPVQAYRCPDHGEFDLRIPFSQDIESSKGTRNMVEIARGAGVEVRVYDA